MKATAPNLRFREARERMALSPDEVAERSGVAQADVWEIEGLPDDLTCFYSVREVQQLCRVLNIRAIELFGNDISEPEISAEELALRIHDECRSRGVTLGQFEELVGWGLSSYIELPEGLLAEMKIVVLQRLCQELRLDWRRVL